MVNLEHLQRLIGVPQTERVEARAEDDVLAHARCDGFPQLVLGQATTNGHHRAKHAIERGAPAVASVEHCPASWPDDAIGDGIHEHRGRIECLVRGALDGHPDRRAAGTTFTHL